MSDVNKIFAKSHGTQAMEPYSGLTRLNPGGTLAAPCRAVIPTVAGQYFLTLAGMDAPEQVTLLGGVEYRLAVVASGGGSEDVLVCLY